MQTNKLYYLFSVTLLIAMLLASPVMAAPNRMSLDAPPQVGVSNSVIEQTDRSDEKPEAPSPITRVETMWEIEDLSTVDWESLVTSQDSRHWAVVVNGEDGVFVVTDGVEGEIVDEANMLTFSPDGNHFAYRARKGSDETVVVNGTAGPIYDTVSTILYSANSKHLALLVEGIGGQQLLLDGDAISFDIMAYIFPDSLVFSPDGTHLAFIAQYETGFTVVIDGRRGPIYDDIIVGSLVFSPDSQHLAYSAVRNNLGQEDPANAPVATSSRTQMANSKNMTVIVRDGVEVARHEWAGNLSYSPDSQYLAYFDARSDTVAAFVDSKEIGVYDEIAAIPVFFSADSQHFAIVAMEDNYEFAVVDGVEGPRYDMIDGNSMIFLPDNRFAYSADDGNDWVIVIDNEEVARHDDLYGPYFSSDGKHMAYMATDGKGWWFAVRDGVQSGHYEIIFGPVLFDQSGEHLFYAVGNYNEAFAVVDGDEGPNYLWVFSCSCDHMPTVAAVGSFSYLVLTGPQFGFVDENTWRIERVTISYVSDEAASEPVPPPAPTSPLPTPADEAVGDYPFAALVTGTVTSTAELRAGPGISFEVVGTVQAQTLVTVVGTDDAEAWYQLDSGHWIAANVIERIASGTATEIAEQAEELHLAAIDKWCTRDFSGALVEINQAISLNPSLANYYNARALIYAALGDYQMALADMETIRARNGTLVDNELDTRAYIYLKMGEYSKAFMDYLKLLGPRKYDSPSSSLGFVIAVTRMSGHSDDLLRLLDETLEKIGPDADDVEALDPRLADLVTWAKEIQREVEKQ